MPIAVKGLIGTQFLTLLRVLNVTSFRKKCLKEEDIRRKAQEIPRDKTSGMLGLTVLF